MYTLGGGEFSLRYIVHANASINTPSYTHVSLYIIWSVYPQGFKLAQLESLCMLFWPLHNTTNKCIVLLSFMGRTTNKQRANDEVQVASHPPTWVGY